MIELLHLSLSSSMIQYICRFRSFYIQFYRLYFQILQFFRLLCSGHEDYQTWCNFWKVWFNQGYPKAWTLDPSERKISSKYTAKNTTRICPFEHVFCSTRNGGQENQGVYTQVLFWSYLWDHCQVTKDIGRQLSYRCHSWWVCTRNQKARQSKWAYSYTIHSWT